ncbi:ABC transporter thiamine pyrophosphate-binding lipoprotein p37/Cypl [Mycoplasma sp. E35C]|uniref:ABC transporter thiamine pyrophosphate-binding lipoprotein p37/Cypl n=1 Tax=Mycoplasma sp. E35C TaxID=2801918 RepID=UPI001CA3B7C4|nr:DNA repair protein [Mycoplasma sp. E35C]QZX49328.1 DNA repair protein [Mycoplasma sp. E35C]
MYIRKKLFLALSSGLFLAGIASSCARSNDELRFELKIDHDANSVLDSYRDKLTELVSNKLNKKIKININVISDGNTIIDNIKANLTDFAFVSSSALRNTDSNEVLPKIQTLTRAFKYDNQELAYGQELNKVSEQVNNLFNEIPYQQWTDDNRMWDGNKYRYFYDTSDSLVKYYRGMILIGGDVDTLTKIKKAWNDKNWEEFASYGIGGGNTTSNGKYLYQLNLLKKHFQKTDLTINNYQIIKGREIGLNKDVHIVFDDMNSFAWTQNNNKQVPSFTWDKNDNNSKVEVLSLTNPALYDIGVFNKKLDKEIVNAISESIIELSNQNKDEYGKTVGYNHYKLINDPEKEVFEFMDLSKN